MAKAQHPLALILLPDVPAEAADLLEAQGHCLYTMQQAVQANITQIDAVVGLAAWRFHPDWWLRDGALSPQAKVMLKAVTTQAYPVAKAKKKRA